MRKWMRDRLKRPKKNAEAGKSGPAQAPLQPAYYDAPEAAAPAAPTKPALGEPEGVEPEIEMQPAPDRPTGGEEVGEARAVPSQRPAGSPAGNDDPRRRRRRGRGGRGRG